MLILLSYQRRVAPSLSPAGLVFGFIKAHLKMSAGMLQAILITDFILSGRRMNFDGPLYLGHSYGENNGKSGETKNRKIQEVGEDFMPVAKIRSVGPKRSKSTSSNVTVDASIPRSRGE